MMACVGLEEDCHRLPDGRVHIKRTRGGEVVEDLGIFTAAQCKARTETLYGEPEYLKKLTRELEPKGFKGPRLTMMPMWGGDESELPTEPEIKRTKNRVDVVDYQRMEAYCFERGTDGLP